MGGCEGKCSPLRHLCNQRGVWDCLPNFHAVYDYLYEEIALQHQNIEDEELSIYNYSYHYSLYVNGAEYCCIHISSIEEASGEKLDEIIQMLLDNMVILNPKDFFIWRDKK